MFGITVIKKLTQIFLTVGLNNIFQLINRSVIIISLIVLRFIIKQMIREMLLLIQQEATQSHKIHKL